MATILFNPSPLVGELLVFGSPPRTWRCKVASPGANQWERVINAGQVVSIFNLVAPYDDHTFAFPRPFPQPYWTLLNYT